MKYYIVDVFCEEKYNGNQLAVVLPEKDISTKQMQKIAREFNFSETTFILPDGGTCYTYKVRIFSPLEELPFAGHPTLGTSYVIKHHVIKEDTAKIVLSLQVGEIPVVFEKKQETEILWMKQVEPDFGPSYTAGEIAPLLGLSPSDFDTAFPIREVSTGLPSIIIPLKNLEAVRKAVCNPLLTERFFEGKEARPFFIFSRECYSAQNHLNSRMFAPSLGIVEDPATGSANGCLAAYLVEEGYFGETEIDIRVEQGYEINRKSLLYVRARKSGSSGASIEIHVGGSVVPVAEGLLY